MSQGTTPERQLFISGDVSKIPFGELRPMCSNPFEWLLAGLIFKVFRQSAPVQFATESRRLVAVDEQQVPGRLMNYFHQMRPQAEQLGFQPNHYATIPAIGPIAIALMTMGEPTGNVCFYAISAALKVNGQITDDSHFGFNSALAGDDLLSTLCFAKLPKPRQGVDRKMIKTDSVQRVHEEHRQRMQGKRITPVPANALFALAQKHNHLETEDLLARGITRLATQADIAQIRSQQG